MPLNEIIAVIALVESLRASQFVSFDRMPISSFSIGGF
jgi:hypothetical protein